jgi:putative nucleotidyltransferase with HDIG domain
MANTNQFTGGLDSSVFKWLGINGVLILLAYPFIPLLSKIFGFTSSIDLVELADLNKPLLKKLSLNAPGTFQHALQVSNLSEAAAEKIGADGLLIKVGALYHDIGKLNNPMLFIENQKEGSYNPHDELNYFDSARGIIDHVIEGEKMGKQSGLPKEIITLICSHHGTTRVEYFYRKQLTDFPDKEFDQTIFQYPGPKPISKEETILMLADSIEAASKSLKQPTGKDIDELVEKIAAHKIQNNQLSESKLTFEEIDICLKVFKEMLRSIYHVRIEYPKPVD